jgi:hypothetical protein
MTQLGERLTALEMPDSDLAMRVAARVIADDASTAPGRARSALRRWLGSLGVGLVIGFAFTQPGRAVTGDLGRLVGIGDEPTVTQYGEVKVASLVIGTAHTPSGSEVDIVASRAVRDHRGDVCFSLDIPLSRAGFGPCLTRYSLKEVEEVGAATVGISATPPEFAAGNRLVLSGLVRERTSGVAASYLDVDGQRQTLPVDFATLTDEQATALGAKDGAAAYFVTLPDGFLSGGDPLLSEREARLRLAGVEATPLNANGQALAPAKLSLEMAVRYLQMTDPPLVTGGLAPPVPPPPTPAPPATAADSLATMKPEAVLASTARLSHADDRLAAVGPPLLIGAGDTPGGDPYELAAFAGAAQGRDRAGIGGVSIGSCASLDYPNLDEPAEFDTTCWGDQDQETLHVSGSSERPELGGKSDVVVSGETKANVADVAVTYINSFGKRVTASGSYGLIDDQVAKKLGTRWTGGHFVAFLPSGDPSGDRSLIENPVVASVIVTAFDGDGNVLEVGTLGGPT